MERVASQLEARRIYGENFIGVEELVQLNPCLPLKVPKIIPEISIPIDVLIENRDTHILILAVNKFTNNMDVNILNLRDYFNTYNFDGANPKFYNQDWYLREEFAKIPLTLGWHLLRIDVIDNSRGCEPAFLKSPYELPSAILSTYSFFVYFLIRKKILWEHDYIWCDDLDHNGDRVYVGKYTDSSGVNSSGFSVHRHLKLRNYFGTISSL